MSEFFVGQRVICADAVSSCGARQQRHHYTVECFNWDNGRELVMLVGVREKVAPYIGWYQSRFRAAPFEQEGIFRKIARDVTEGRKLEIIE